MSDQVWKYLPHVPTVKKPIVLKRKSEVTDKQVLNLTGGLFPLKVAEHARHDRQPQQLDHWVRVPIVQRNSKIGPIYHWVKQGEQKKLYHGQKFNVEHEMVSFSQQEFNSLQLDIAGITFAKAQRIFETLEKFNLNFVVAHDRLGDEEYSLEDIKEIYFRINRQVLLLRGQGQNLLAHFVYDKKFESNRKYQLEKYLMRSKLDTDREKHLISEIRRLQIMIKKEERDQINLKKALRLDEAPEEVFRLEESVDKDEMRRKQRVFTRQQYLSRPLELPGKINQRLVEVLQGMNIPDKIAATDENVDLYDKLRQKVLLMFSIQRYIRKKEGERRMLQQKKKRLASLEQDDKSKSSSKMANQRPQKKIHTSK